MSLLTSQPNWFDSTETGAPVLNNALGALVTLLKAVLVNGFNVKSVSQIEVVSGVATVTCASHGYSASFGKLVAIAGAPVPALNGNFQIAGVTTNTFAFPAVGVADGVYTGTIDARRAPLGWEIAYENGGGTVVIFRRTAPESTAMMLRVNDSAASGASATDARVLMIESATDVDTYADHSPTTAQISGGGYWYKGSNNTTAKQWALVGNDRFFWLSHPSGSNFSPYDAQLNHFGDGLPFRTPDAFFCTISAPSAGGGSAASAGCGIVPAFSTPSTFLGCVVARNFSASNKSVVMHKSGCSAGAAVGVENVGQLATDVVAISRVYFFLDTEVALAGGGIRGEVPGLAGPLARVPFAAAGQFSLVTPEIGDGRTYLSILYSSVNTRGNALINLTGPWF